MSLMKIIIVGTGAVGGLFAFRLSQDPSVEVSLICRSNYEEVQQYGISIVSEQYGEHTYRPHKVYRSIDDASKSGERFDLIAVTMKNIPELGSVADLIEPLVTESSVILLVQNGLDIELPFFEKYPKVTLISCVTNVAVSQISPGKLDHKKVMHLAFGVYPKEKTNASESIIQKVSDILSTAEVEFSAVPDIEMLRWTKLLWNGSFSPICILTGGCDTFYIHEDQDAKRLIKDTMLEIKSLGEKVIGKELPSGPYPTIDEYIDSTLGVHYKPSLLLDFERKNPLELETTLGAMVRAAREISHPIPIVTTLYSLAKLSDKKNRGVL